MHFLYTNNPDVSVNCVIIAAAQRKIMNEFLFNTLVPLQLIFWSKLIRLSHWVEWLVTFALWNVVTFALWNVAKERPPEFPAAHRFQSALSAFLPSLPFSSEGLKDAVTKATAEQHPANQEPFSVTHPLHVYIPNTFNTKPQTPQCFSHICSNSFPRLELLSCWQCIDVHAKPH